MQSILHVSKISLLKSPAKKICFKLAQIVIGQFLFVCCSEVLSSGIHFREKKNKRIHNYNNLRLYGTQKQYN